jgi:putative photosynthetic complex assembly protein
MSHPAGNGPFPRGPLIGAAVMISFTIAAATFVRQTGIGKTTEVDAPTVAARSLYYDDKPDGSIAVIDARDNRLITTLEPGTNGFIRGTMRGLVRERKSRGVGREEPFELISRADGRLTLLDPATGRRIDLESFGPTNTAAFAQLLQGQKDRPAP